MIDLKSCKKIAIIGSPGSGKTTLATKLSNALNLPVHHLDLYQWERDWVKRDRAAFIQDHRALCMQDRWIIDGCGIRATFDERVQHADAIIFLDIPRERCVWRLLKRWWQTRKTDLRTDVPAGCRDRLSVQFFSYVWTYPGKYRQKIIDILDRVQSQKITLILRSDYEIKTLLQSI